MGGLINRVGAARLAVAVLGAYLVAVGIVVSVPDNTPTALRVCGILAAVAGAVQIARMLRPQADRTDTALLQLDDRAPELAATIRDTLALLDGPLGALLDRGVVADTRASFDAAIEQADRLYHDEAAARRTLTTLTDTLRRAGRKAKKDPQVEAARARVTALADRRAKVERELQESAEQLDAAIARAASAKQERATRGELTALREKVAGTVDLGAPEGTAIEDLDDAVAGVRGRLDAVGELDALTDRVSPDAAEEAARDA